MEGICTSCNKFLPLVKAGKKKDGSQRYQSLCNPCNNGHIKNWRKNNPDYYRDYYESNRAKWMFQGAKQRALDSNLEFNISIEDIFIPEECPVRKIPFSIGSSKRNDNTPTLDRIDNSKGYIKGNVRVISWRANCLKKDGTLEEFKQLVNYLENEYTFT